MCYFADAQEWIWIARPRKREWKRRGFKGRGARKVKQLTMKMKAPALQWPGWRDAHFWWRVKELLFFLLSPPFLRQQGWSTQWEISIPASLGSHSIMVTVCQLMQQQQLSITSNGHSMQFQARVCCPTDCPTVRHIGTCGEEEHHHQRTLISCVFFFLSGHTSKDCNDSTVYLHLKGLHFRMHFINWLSRADGLAICATAANRHNELAQIRCAFPLCLSSARNQHRFQPGTIAEVQLLHLPLWSHQHQGIPQLKQLFTIWN